MIKDYKTSKINDSDLTLLSKILPNNIRFTYSEDEDQLALVEKLCSAEHITEAFNKDESKILCCYNDSELTLMNKDFSKIFEKKTDY